MNGLARPTFQPAVTQLPFPPWPVNLLATSGVTPFPWTDRAIIAGLILLNGVFAMSELAIVSARPARLQVDGRSAAAKGADRAAAGRGSGQVPLDRADRHHADRHHRRRLFGREPGRAGGRAAGSAGRAGRICRRSRVSSLVIALTTYFSLVVGELVPKQLALRAAVPIALVMARPMAMLARIAAPFVWLLDQLVGHADAAARHAPQRRARADRRRTADDLRRGDPLGRDRGRRTRDHGRHHAAGRAPGARIDDPAHRTRLDRCRSRGTERDPRGDRRNAAFAAAGGRRLARQIRRRGQGARCAGRCWLAGTPSISRDRCARSKSCPTSSTRWTRCASFSNRARRHGDGA